MQIGILNFFLDILNSFKGGTLLRGARGTESESSSNQSFCTWIGQNSTEFWQVWVQ